MNTESFISEYIQEDLDRLKREYFELESSEEGFDKIEEDVIKAAKKLKENGYQIKKILKNLKYRKNPQSPSMGNKLIFEDSKLQFYLGSSENIFKLLELYLGEEIGAFYDEGTYTYHTSNECRFQFSFKRVESEQPKTIYIEIPNDDIEKYGENSAPQEAEIIENEFTKKVKDIMEKVFNNYNFNVKKEDIKYYSDGCIY